MRASVASQNQPREVGVEVSRARVSQFGLKTGGGMMAGGAHCTIVEVVSRTS
jgi:hypothetical protein